MVLELSKVTESSIRVASVESGFLASDNTFKHCCIQLTDYYSRAKQEQNMKPWTHSGMDLHYRWRVMPTSGNVHLLTSLSDYPIIDHPLWWQPQIREMLAEMTRVSLVLKHTQYSVPV